MGALFPGFAAIEGHVNAGTRSAGFEEPGPAPELPHGRNEFVRIRGVHDQISDAGAIIDIQDFHPGFAAIGGFVNAAVRRVSPGRTLRAHVHHVRIFRMDDDAMTVARVVKPEVRPGFARVQAFVHAVAAGLTVARVAFAGAHPNHVRIGLGDGHRADGCHRLLIKNRLPVDAAAGGFPQATRGCADVDDVGLAQHHIDGGDSTAHARRTNAARLHALELVHVEFLRLDEPRQSQD